MKEREIDVLKVETENENRREAARNYKYLTCAFLALTAVYASCLRTKADAMSASEYGLMVLFVMALIGALILYVGKRSLFRELDKHWSYFQYAIAELDYLDQVEREPDVKLRRHKLVQGITQGIIRVQGKELAGVRSAHSEQIKEFIAKRTACIKDVRVSIQQILMQMV